VLLTHTHLSRQLVWKDELDDATQLDNNMMNIADPWLLVICGVGIDLMVSIQSVRAAMCALFHESMMLFVI
jgi:hypothetical protein